MSWLAIDIGGANLKLADGKGMVAAAPFALWKAPQQLGAELGKLIGHVAPAQRIAITMTGELVDCFASKTEGVNHILSAVEAAFPAVDCQIYLVDGRFVSTATARDLPLLAAASNWHALARFAGRFVRQQAAALLIDVGSTTCDIIPLSAGIPTTCGLTDTTRMLAGELLYTGVQRSPCCAIRETVTYRGSSVPVAQWFATMQDVYVLLNQIPADADDCDTADARPSTPPNAIRRLGKLVCADELEFTTEDAQVIARELADHQAQRLAAAVERVLTTGKLTSAPTQLVLSGHGEFLAQAALDLLKIDLPIISLTQQLGPTVSRCAPAHALACLASETFA